MSECGSCGAPIRWVLVAKSDKPMPLDPVAVDGGNIAIDSQGKARVLAKGDTALGPTYVSHFFTCPDRDEWRK